MRYRSVTPKLYLHMSVVKVYNYNMYEMRNQNGYVPEHLQEGWEAANKELAESQQELDDASKRFNAAIIGRIAMSQALLDWQNTL